MLREAKTEAQCQHRSRDRDKDIFSDNVRHRQADRPQTRSVRAREAIIFAIMASPSLTQKLERLDGGLLLDRATKLSCRVETFGRSWRRGMTDGGS